MKFLLLGIGFLAALGVSEVGTATATLSPMTSHVEHPELRTLTLPRTLTSPLATLKRVKRLFFNPFHPDHHQYIDRAYHGGYGNHHHHFGGGHYHGHFGGHGHHYGHRGGHHHGHGHHGGHHHHHH